LQGRQQQSTKYEPAKSRDNAFLEGLSKVNTVHYSSKNLRSPLRPENLVLLLLLLIVSTISLHAQDREDLDAHTIRFDGFWFYSQPSGSFHGTGSQGLLNFQSDVHFNSYSTGVGRIDWKFTHKNHIYVGATPVSQSKGFMLARTITFEGQTFNVGLLAHARLQTYFFTPGYQYDIFRRRRWHLGIAAQLNLLYISGTLQTAAQIANGVSYAAKYSSSVLRAPLPVLGPEGRVYLTHSGRLFVDGNLYGLYFFGYGDFLSSHGTLGIRVNRHLNFQGGYQLSSRVNIHAKTDRIGLNLTQRGAVAGLEVSF
jgi:hypothetical protein